MAIWKLKIAIWKLKLAIWKVKNEVKNSLLVLKPKMINNDKKKKLDRGFSKMTAPNFGPNSLCGPNTVFQTRGQTKGGPRKTPQKDTICSKHTVLKLKSAI